jgi:hypothetical protein
LVLLVPERLLTEHLSSHLCYVASTRDGADSCAVRDPQHAASLTVGAAAVEAPGLQRSTSASRLAAAALLQAAARRERRNSFSEIYSWEGLQVTLLETPITSTASSV